MKKGQVLTGVVERVDFPNKGIVITPEGICIVKNVLPGQKITLTVQKKRNGKVEGRLLRIEENSPLEQKSPCPHFGECGGCTYLSLPYEEQLKIKEKQVYKLLKNALAGQSSQWKFEGIKGSPTQSCYRNKMEFSFGDEYKDGPLSLGMHKRGSFYDIVTVCGCQIVDEDYRKILVLTRNYFEGSSFYHRIRHTGYLRHLLVRKASKTGEILIALVTTSQPEFYDKASNVDMGAAPEESDLREKSHQAEKERLIAFKNALLELNLDGKIVGILHIINDSAADVVQSDRTEILYGQDFFFEELLGLKFKISTFSFFQTNSLGAEVLYETAREYIGDLGENSQEENSGKIVFDLYSGTGTIAQLMAPAAKKVIGVEIVEEAVEAARKNAELNGLHNCEFIAGDVLKVLDDIEEYPDMIILDPPRDGIHPKALKKIIAYGIEKLLYISCKPTSLVRDLEVFLENGYVVERAVAVDQFPWTANIETCVLLSKLKSTQHIDVKIDLDEMDLTKAESKATYAEIKQYVLEKHGLKVSQLYIAQVKRKHGIIERVNYNVGEGKAKVPQVPLEKEKAIEDALRHFQMI
ncbi:23S rRNA (uracil-5-)-methyltransferase RumA [Lachnospiraceae bacterium 10-1]|nr:23S rRNA (uracil-5-)-methyltransferase RumA [Lachnospiraceae bacterium 10-1]